MSQSSLDLLEPTKSPPDPDSCLSAAVGHLFNNEFSSDVHFVLQNTAKRRKKDTVDRKETRHTGLDCREPEIPGHKVILASRSKVFQAMFYGHMLESKEKDNCIVRIVDVDAEAFLSMLRFIYTDTTQHITSDNAMAVLYAANKYGVEKLREACLKEVQKTLSADSVVQFWESATRQGEDQVVVECLNFLQRDVTFFRPGHPGFCSMSPSTLATLLSSDMLPVSELSLFQAVLEWIRRRELPPTSFNSSDGPFKEVADQYADVIKLIRFPTIATEDIAKHVAPSGILSDQQLLQLLLHKASKESPIGFNVRCRWVSQAELRYSHDFDHNGAIYHIATKGGTAAFLNPHSTGEIIVTASSLQSSTGGIELMVSRRAVCLWTSNIPGSWVAVDLGERRELEPNFYTLQHGYRAGEDGLRNWAFEGSRDGKDWVVLSSHTNEATIGVVGFDSHSWPISNTQGKAYRHFRVRSTGPDASGRHFVTVCGLEVYGRLFCRAASPS